MASVVGAVIVPGGTTAAAEADAPAGRVGVSSHLVWRGEQELAANLADLTSRNVRWIREDFAWDRLEPTQGSYDWTITDRLMRATAAAGVDVLAILDYSARWASSDPSGGGDIYYPPRNPDEFASFAARVVDRYGATGTFWTANPTIPKRPLAAVQLWNEPWGYWFWKPAPDVAAYARLAETAARAVKAVDPTVDVVVAADLNESRRDGTTAPWFSALLSAAPGLPAVVDGWAVHPYPWPKTKGPLDTTIPLHDRFTRVTMVNDVAVAHDVQKPLWITEVGWSTASGSSSGVTEDQQATFLRDAVATALGWPFVARTFVYTWGRDGTDQTDMEAHFGLHRADGTPKPALAALTELLASGSDTAEPAPPTTTAPPTPTRTTKRLAGKNRFATAAAISAEGWAGGSATAFLASADTFPDALTTGALAGRQDGPVLLTAGCSLPAETAAELVRLAPERVVVVGGTAVICPAVVEQVGALVQADVVRLAGGDRYATAAALTRAAWPTTADTVFVASGVSFADGLAAAGGAAAKDAPLLLADRCALPAATASELARLRPTRVVLVGGESAVCSGVATAVRAVVPATVDRLAGGDRYATAVAVARDGWPAQAAEALIATGIGFADGLAAGALSARVGAPLLLVPGCGAVDAARGELERLGVAGIAVVGGEQAVCEPVVAALG